MSSVDPPQLTPEALERRSRDELIGLILAQAETLERQDVQIADLEARVAVFERRQNQNSENSSLPPSRDGEAVRQSRAERRATQRERAKGRRPGKQPGDEGHRLAPVAVPDAVVPHAPTTCRGCGRSLGRAPVVAVERRQVFELPPQWLQVTEHRAERRRCVCGAETTAPFPAAAKAETCFGPRLRAYATYLLVRQHLPVERTAELLADLLGASVSTGWLAGLSAEAAAGLAPFMAELSTRLTASPVAHADETGARVAGRKHWVHVCCTATETLLAVHPRRGQAATDDIGVLPRFAGVLVHDRWAPYWRYPQMRHALCNSHLLRDLAAVAELPVQRPWAVAMSALLVEGIRRTNRARESGRDRLSRRARSELRRRYAALLEQAFAANPEPAGGRKRYEQKAGYNLAVALRDHRDEALRFLDDLAVPPTNNQAERDLRMMKLQMKISGCFRTLRGAECFATVRSYIETARKHSENPLAALEHLFRGEPWRIPRLAPS